METKVEIYSSLHQVIVPLREKREVHVLDKGIVVDGIEIKPYVVGVKYCDTRSGQVGFAAAQFRGDAPSKDASRVDARLLDRSLPVAQAYALLDARISTRGCFVASVDYDRDWCFGIESARNEEHGRLVRAIEGSGEDIEVLIGQIVTDSNKSWQERFEKSSRRLYEPWNPQYWTLEDFARKLARDREPKELRQFLSPLEYASLIPVFCSAFAGEERLRRIEWGIEQFKQNRLYGAGLRRLRHVELAKHNACQQNN